MGINFISENTICPKLVKELCKEAAKIHHTTPNKILGRSKVAHVVDARRYVAKHLRELGFSYPVIGRALDRHHTSIIYLVDDDFRHGRKKRMVKRFNEREKIKQLEQRIIELENQVNFESNMRANH